MTKENQIIMVVKRDVLFANHEDYFNGIYTGKRTDFESRTLANAQYMRRGKEGDKTAGKESAEESPEFKQPIGYCLVVNPNTKKVYAYRRASKEKYDENRLEGKWSWGVGGHVEKADRASNLIRESMMREISEEIMMNGKINSVVPLGYINDDASPVGRVHFGILYAAFTDSSNITPGDSESETGKLMDIAELEQICNSPDCSVESWSAVAINPLKTLLG